jgi:hypothetical protein
VAAAAALALTAVAAPTAFLVEVTTSVAIEDIHDEAALKDALRRGRWTAR